MEPVPPPPHVFAVGSGEVRLARFAAAAAGLEIVGLDAADLPEDSFGHGFLGGVPREPAELEGRIGSLLETAGDGVEDASLVLPDAWLRVTFIELDELPAEPDERDEVLRWKLKRLVPFRVEELRLGATPVATLPTQDETLRVMVGYALEGLVGQLERVFGGRGVRLGRITNGSLALLRAVAETMEAAELAALTLVEPGAYTLVLARRGEPVLHRYKPQKPAGAAALAGLVARDLKLTLSFLEEQFPERPLDASLLVAPPAVEEVWLERLEAGLGVPAVPVRSRHLPLAADPGGDAPWVELAPLLGAACWEVS